MLLFPADDRFYFIVIVLWINKEKFFDMCLYAMTLTSCVKDFFLHTRLMIVAKVKREKKLSKKLNSIIIKQLKSKTFTECSLMQSWLSMGLYVLLEKLINRQFKNDE